MTRLARVACFAVTALALGASAHEAAGGAVPVRLAAFSLPVLMLLVNPLAGRRRGLRVLLPLMAVIQAGLHFAFMAASAAAGCHLLPGPAHATMPGPAMTMRCDAPMDHGLQVTGLPMTAAHLLAAVLMVALLARGDAVLWALAASVRFRVLPVSWTPAVLVSARAVLVGESPVRQLAAHFSAVVRRRGPPAGTCITR